MESDSLTALLAQNSLGAIAGKVFGQELHDRGLPLEEFLVCESRVGLCQSLFARKLTEAQKRFGFDGLLRSHAKSAVAREIQEGCCHLAPISEFQRPVSQPAPEDHFNDIR